LAMESGRRGGRSFFLSLDYAGEKVLSLLWGKGCNGADLGVIVLALFRGKREGKEEEEALIFS